MRPIVFAAMVEAVATGVLLIISPSLFASLILGSEPGEPGRALGRIAGIAMLGLGLACWPREAAAAGSSPGPRVLLLYNLLATAYLLYLATGGRFAGILLWPAIALHALLSALIVGAWRYAGDSPASHD